MTKKIFLIIGVILIIALVLFFAYNSGDSTTANKPATTSAGKSITYDENSLLARGVTSDQLNSMEQALGQYLNSQNESSAQVSFNTIVRPRPDPANPNPYTELTFIVQVDGKPLYKARLGISSSSDIRLYLYTLDGSTQLYDSQNVRGSS